MPFMMIDNLKELRRLRREARLRLHRGARLSRAAADWCALDYAVELAREARRVPARHPDKAELELERIFRLEDPRD